MNIRHYSPVILLLALASPLRAELPSPRFDRLKPLGVSAGGTVEVEVAGRDTEDVNQLLFDHPGLKAELVKPGRFKVQAAADVPEGTYDVRLVGRFGVSNPRLFAVSHGLLDTEEKEPNNQPSEAQAIGINVAVNGTCDGNGQDAFRFTAQQGQRLTIACQAGKLDSELDAVLTVYQADGRIVASSGDYLGRDPLIDFLAPADGDYLVVINDLSYRGGYPYRLIVSERPCVENVFPRAVEPGKPAELTALGWNFGSSGRPSTWKLEGHALDEFKFTIDPPADAAGAYRFLEHPTDHSVLPTAATCTLNGFQVRVPIADGAMHPATLMLAEGPVTLEAEPNDDPHKPQPLTLPATAIGRFDQPRDADWYEVEADENGAYQIEVFSERIAGRADPYVVVVDDKDQRLTELDDFGHRINAFDGHLRDPVGNANLSKGRKYRLLVQDRYSRGGVRYQYVLTIRKAVPDFFVAAIHSDNPGPAGTNLWRGGTASLDLVIHQRDGYRAPLTITAEGLPPGVHALPMVIDGDTRGTFVLWSDAEAAEWTGTIRLVAVGKRGDTELRREVRPYARVWNNTNMNSSRPTRELAIALRDKAPYELHFKEQQVTAEAGQKLELALVATRFWPECKEAIRVIAQQLPAGLKLPDAQIAAGKTEATCTLDVPPNSRPGQYTITVTGQCQVPYNKDPKGASRPNSLVAMPSRPITITVVPKPK